MQRFAIIVSILGLRPSLASSPFEEMPSDAHFMHKDYPADSRPKVTKQHKRYDFDHPYPIIQEDKDYDADFVKDENDDGGEWKAQETYDHLRNSIAKYKAEIERLKAKLAGEERIVQEKTAVEAKLESESTSKDKEWNEAKGLADKAQDRVDDLKAQVAEAQKAVNKELSELEECRKELLTAKHKLEQELKKHRDSEGADDSKVKNRLEQIDKEVSDVEGKEEELEKSADKGKSALRRAQLAYDQKLAQVKATEALLEKAEAALRRLRRAEDPDGGVYWKAEHGHKRSSAPTLGSHLASSICLAVALALCAA